ncbi:MAG: adenylate/guanylate cyclase domain-containing protein [Bacteroidales bacterium]
MERQDNELLKRLQKLTKHNSELAEINEKLARLNMKLIDENDQLSAENDRLKKILRSDKVLKEVENKEVSEQQRSLKFKMATVLFADIHGLRHLRENMDSQAIMDELDEIYFHFDKIIKKYNIEKIKTIGDSYMSAGGIPVKNITNPVEVVLAALKMQNILRDKQKNGQNGEIWKLRVGIHTGPVTAGISGQRKVSYDIKGDTVNIASRMEAFGEYGSILISVMTYELVKELFLCEYYGKMPVKYKGDLEVFRVKGIRPEYSLDGAGLEPNADFDTKFKLIQFSDIQEVILDKLEKELPANLYYHNVKHTVDVVTEVELIGWAEGVNDADILLLKTAALFHDAGHIISYKDHEERSCELAREYLPGYNYSAEQIERICQIIMATKLPPEPKDLLEKIICDSDLDYLGRSDFIPVSNTLFKELKERDMIGTLNDWNKLQIKFISGHQYFTETACRLREINKQKQIERIKSLLEE